MRTTVLILGLILGLAFFLQSFMVFATTGGADPETSAAQAGAWGILCAFLWLLGAALVTPRPGASVVAFGLAGVLALLALTLGAYSDLGYWAVASGLLAVLSWRARLEKQRQDAEAAAERAERQALLRHLERAGTPR